MVLHARHVPGQTLGTIVVESIWPAAAFGGAGHGINVLTSNEPALPAGGAVFHDTAVWVRPEAAEVALAAELPLGPAAPAGGGRGGPRPPGRCGSRLRRGHPDVLTNRLDCPRQGRRTARSARATGPKISSRTTDVPGDMPGVAPVRIAAATRGRPPLLTRTRRRPGPAGLARYISSSTTLRDAVEAEVSDGQVGGVHMHSEALRRQHRSSGLRGVHPLGGRRVEAAPDGLRQTLIRATENGSALYFVVPTGWIAEMADAAEGAPALPPPH